MLKKAVGLTCIGLFIISAIGVASHISADVSEKVHPKYASHIQHHAPMAEIEPQAITDKLNKAWNESKMLINKANANKYEKWTLIDSGDIDIRFTNDLSAQEAFSFNQALFHEERRANLQVGDTAKAILLSPSQHQAVLFWQRANGNAVYLELKSKKGKDGEREWYVDTRVQEISKDLD